MIQLQTDNFQSSFSRTLYPMVTTDSSQEEVAGNRYPDDLLDLAAETSNWHRIAFTREDRQSKTGLMKMLAGMIPRIAGNGELISQEKLDGYFSENPDDLARLGTASGLGDEIEKISISADGAIRLTGETGRTVTTSIINGWV